MLFLLTISTRSLPSLDSTVIGAPHANVPRRRATAQAGPTCIHYRLVVDAAGVWARRGPGPFILFAVTCFVLRESSSHFDSPPLASLIQGEVTQTYSAVRVGDALALWRFVLAVAMEESYSLTFNEIAQLADLEQSAPEPSQQRLYSRPNSEETKLRADLAPPHFGDVVWAEHYSDAMPPILQARDLHTFDALHPVALAKVSLFYLL